MNKSKSRETDGEGGVNLYLPCFAPNIESPKMNLCFITLFISRYLPVHKFEVEGNRLETY
jgi:hypothetical protein